jgi:hypothetical protein
MKFEEYLSEGMSGGYSGIIDKDENKVVAAGLNNKDAVSQLKDLKKKNPSKKYQLMYSPGKKVGDNWESK